MFVQRIVNLFHPQEQGTGVQDMGSVSTVSRPAPPKKFVKTKVTTMEGPEKRSFSVALQLSL